MKCCVVVSHRDVRVISVVSTARGGFLVAGERLLMLSVLPHERQCPDLPTDVLLSFKV